MLFSLPDKISRQGQQFCSGAERSLSQALFVLSELFDGFPELQSFSIAYHSRVFVLATTEARNPLAFWPSGTYLLL